MTSQMQYRTDPKSGNRLSALGFGCMRFPKNAAACDELVTSAVEAGINYFDTAHMYAGSEASLGGILKRHGLREKVFLADKLPHFHAAARPGGGLRGRPAGHPHRKPDPRRNRQDIGRVPGCVFIMRHSHPAQFFSDAAIPRM